MKVGKKKIVSILVGITMLLSSMALFGSVNVYAGKGGGGGGPKGSISASNEFGQTKETFDLEETVFVTAIGLTGDIHYQVYVVPSTIDEEDNLANADVTIGPEKFTTNLEGELEINVIWWYPDRQGTFKIVVDIDFDGLYDSEDLSCTISVSDEPIREVHATDEFGNRDSGFYWGDYIPGHGFTGESIYTKGGFFPHSTEVDIYVVDDMVEWFYGYPLEDKSGGVERVLIPSTGNLPKTCIWPSPMMRNAGIYDIVVDVDLNGIFSIGDAVSSGRLAGITIAGEPPPDGHLEDEIASFGYLHQDYFAIGQKVYAYVNPSYRGGIPMGSQSDIYVFLDRHWYNGDILNEEDDISGGIETITPQFGCNNHWVTLIWPSIQKVDHGYYDVIIDWNQNGVYDIGYDLLDKHIDFGFTLTGRDICSSDTHWQRGVDTFDIYETVFIEAKGLLSATHYDVYVVPESITPGEDLAPAEVSVGSERFTTNMKGVLEGNVIWWFPDVTGMYRIVIDDNWNGFYDIDDLNMVITVTDLDLREIYATHSNGDMDCGFLYDESIYVKGKGFLPSTDIYMYVVDDKYQWRFGDPLVDESGGVEVVTTTPTGEIPNTCIWPIPGPEHIGIYDLIADADQDGIYSVGDAIFSDRIVGFTVRGEGESLEHNEQEIAAGWRNNKDYFNLGEKVYAYMNPTAHSISGTKGKLVDIYVYLDKVWTDGDPLSDVDDVSGGHESATLAKSCGNTYYCVEIWPSIQKIEHGYYDVIIDVDRNGVYDIEDDVLDKHMDFGFTLVDNIPEWTFMVYLDADNSLEGAGIEDMNEMETVGSVRRANIVVQMDRINGYDTSNGDWKGARRYYITKDDDPNIITSTMVQDLGEVNMGDATTVIDFVQWAKLTYPASRYALIYWDHGSGFFGVCSDDTSGGDKLTMEELKSAMATITNNGDDPIDVTGFDACLMAMTEVAYQLEYKGATTKPMTDYIVGSENVEPEDGWPYELILDDLVNIPTMMPDQLATTIVNDYIYSYTDGEGDPNDDNTVTMSAIQMGNIGDTSIGLIQDLDTFASELINPLEDLVWKSSYRSTYTSARQFTDAYAPWAGYFVFRDLYYFAEYLSHVSNLPTGGPYNNNIITAAQTLMGSISTAIIAEGHGSDKLKSAGLSIYYPPSRVDYDSLYNNLDFAQDTLWDEFLNAYYFDKFYIDDVEFGNGQWLTEDNTGDWFAYGGSNKCWHTIKGDGIERDLVLDLDLRTYGTLSSLTISFQNIRDRADEPEDQCALYFFAEGVPLGFGTTFDDDTTGWELSEYDIDPLNLQTFENNVVRVDFKYETDFDATSEGWWIDNVEIIVNGNPFFFDDMESGTGDWMYCGWEYGYKENQVGDYWHISQLDCYSSTSSWWCGDEVTGQYVPGLDNMLTMITLPLYQYQFAELSFWTKYDFNDANDYVELEMRSDSTPWFVLDTYTGSSAGWVQKSYDLSIYTGEAVQLRFHIYSDGSGESTGMFIDDFEVEVDQAKVAEWTYIGYFDGDNNLEKCMIADLNELEFVGSTTNVNFIIMLDRWDGYNYGDPEYQTDDDDRSNGNWDNTRTFYVTKDITGDGQFINSFQFGPIHHQTIFARGVEHHMGDPNTLSNFANWVKQNYPANNYVLVLSDHGGGIDGICWDEKNNGNNLAFDEIETAMDSITNGGTDPVEVLQLAVCLCQMEEMNFELQVDGTDTPYMNYLVASEEISWGSFIPSKNFRGVAQYIVDNWNTATGHSISIEIVDRYYEDYRATQAITMSAVDMNYITAPGTNLGLAVDDLAYILREAMNNELGYRASVTGAMNNADHYADVTNMDLYHFAIYLTDSGHLSGGSYDGQIISAATEVCDILSNGVIANVHTSPHDASQGVAIYFPEFEYLYDPAVYGPLDLAQGSWSYNLFDAYWL